MGSSWKPSSTAPIKATGVTICGGWGIRAHLDWINFTTSIKVMGDCLSDSSLERIEPASHSLARPYVHQKGFDNIMPHSYQNR
jgi:hypothetical protein